MGCSWLLITYFIKASNLLSKWIAAIKGSSHMLPRNEAFLTASWYSIFSNNIPSSGMVQIICKIINIVGCPRHLIIASKLLRIKTCLGGVFWVFHGSFSIVRHLSREPDFLAENQIFKNFLKSLKTCLVGVSWVFHGIFSIIRHLSREPDFSTKNRIFKNFIKCLKACLVGVFWVF